MEIFSNRLSNVEVEAWYSHKEQKKEIIINDGEGCYTITIVGTTINHYLSVKKGTRAYSLCLGKAVTAKGKDDKGIIVTTAVMETTAIGEIAQFKGPYHIANNSVGPTTNQSYFNGLIDGNGAQFWSYLSSNNETPKHVTEWKITLTQGDWVGEICSSDHHQILMTNGLSGKFGVTVEASGPNMPKKLLKEKTCCSTVIEANLNCASMIGIVSNKDGKDANYWIISDAFCNPLG